MARVLITGFWICAITLLSCYGAVKWGAGLKIAKQEEYLEGLEYRKVRAVNVPVIAEGAVQGYVIANLVFTADARTLRSLSVPIETFFIDETFRQIYSDEKLDFRRLSKYDVPTLLASIKRKVNERMGAEIVKDVLVENFNFVNKSDIRS
ncbi:hypothetical protein [Microvirga thermotolerans]|uniref:Flagellar basal body-associated protein FliL n=1 Tax=Microvirga thermotolerans TaxID=2651334 RepID=A0A5P9JYX1_9HYPH|nr:hypothetical protein [Microvirga thermotolerans]QFU17643.1 hypothetical protein GDR74_16270 [Microvirga thermotolerans]